MLIKITTDEQDNQLVDARELHDFVVKQAKGGQDGEMYAHWIKRMIDFGFELDKDYTVLEYNYSGAQISKSDNQRVAKRDYLFTLDSAKQIAMIQRNDKGKEARQYFIKMEKQAKSAKVIDFSDANAVLALAQNFVEEQNKRKEAEAKVKKLEPKAETLDRIVQCDELVSMSQVAKVLGLPFGRNTLYMRLRDMGILFKNLNEPKQRYINQGWFTMKETMITRKNHKPFMVMTPLVTQKGLVGIAKLFPEDTRNNKKVRIS